MTRLATANLLLVTLLVLHALDHGVRQSAEVPAQVAVPGLLAQVLAVGVLALALARHPLAAPASVTIGFGTALGFVLVHVLPTWWTFSQAFAEIPVDALSWTSMLACIPAALLVGDLGRRALALSTLRSA